jgi:hypothetical protein
LGGSGGGFINLAFVDFENFLEDNGDDFTKLAFRGSEIFLEGSVGEFTKLAVVAWASLGGGRGIA